MYWTLTNVTNQVTGFEHCAIWLADGCILQDYSHTCRSVTPSASIANKLTAVKGVSALHAWRSNLLHSDSQNVQICDRRTLSRLGTAWEVSYIQYQEAINMYILTRKVKKLRFCAWCHVSSHLMSGKRMVGSTVMLEMQACWNLYTQFIHIE